MDETSTIAAVIAALVLWRLVVSVLVAVAVATALMFVAPGSSPFVAIAIVILGIAAGIVWQSRAEFPLSQPADPSVSRPVAFLGLAFVGVFWGGILEFATGSSFAAAAFLAATPTLSSPIIIAITRRALSFRQLVFATLALVAGLGVVYVMRSIVSGAGA
ncbi:hypothetical protein [Diaphorobacter nitroreducens]|uniref:hypothetical protein n=1 Tax=Diaphorobacter nitroreducens TaxID=164759 RepID=UPI00289DDB9B|nr:hypothetical protein [Diaphorobacter nitroreducens]